MQNSQFFATTWINLQDAYTVEADDVGTWAQIGYNAPGTYANSSSTTTNFTYSDGEVSSNEVTWTATANVKLNDCDKGGTWTATAKAHAANDNSGNTYVSIETGGDDLCTGLTPSFGKLARDTQ